MSQAQAEYEVSRELEEELWRESLEAKHPSLRLWPGRKSTMTVYKKLNDARQRFHELKLTKTGENKFAGYKYFELGDFLIPALKVFNEVGLCAIVSFDKDTATMVIMDAEKGPEGECIRITSPMGSAALKGCHEVQNIGAVETYQRRYLWVAALEIVEHDALDATTGKDKDAKGVTTGSFRSSPTMGEFDNLPPEQQTYIRDLAMEVMGAFSTTSTNEEREAAVKKVEYENLDDTQKMGLWGLLDSKTRAAFKKTQTAMKEPA